MDRGIGGYTRAKGVSFRVMGDFSLRNISRRRIAMDAATCVRFRCSDLPRDIAGQALSIAKHVEHL